MEWPRKGNLTNLNCGTAMNIHRIRELLARGKAIVSEKTGSILDEELYGGLVELADSDDLVEATLRLLEAPALRWDLEQRALQFMLSDHFAVRTQTPQESSLSSLFLTARALLSTAGEVFRTTGIRLYITHHGLLAHRVHMAREHGSQPGRLETGEHPLQDQSAAFAAAS